MATIHIMKFFSKKKIADSASTEITDMGGFKTMLGNAALQERKDVLNNSTFTRSYRLPQEVCENVYMDSWVGKRIVELPVRLAMKNGLMFESTDKEGEKRVWDLYHKLKIKEMIIDSQSAADVYGSSLILLQDTAQDAEKELAEFINPSFVPVQFPFYTVEPSPKDIYKAGIVNFATLGLRAHESFCAVFIGVPAIMRLSPSYKYFGMSVYQSIWTALVNDQVIMSACANITYRSSIRNYRLDGLSQLVQAGKQNLVLERASLLDTSASIFGSVVMDAKDEMQVVSQSIAGLADIDKRSAERLSAATGIPATLLLGKSPDGQNSTGQHDKQNFELFIENYQMKMLPAIHKIFEGLVALAGVKDKNWRVNFNTPATIDISEKPKFDAQVLANAATMMNELNLPEELVRAYLLKSKLITQEEHDEIKLEVKEFDEIDETDSSENN